MNKSLGIFQESFAKSMDADCAVSFWKARVGLYAILKALGIAENDEVILPGYACVMDVNPIKYLGAKPVYVDIEPRTFNINVNQLEAKITSKTKVIIAQHTYGYPCDMDSILEIAKRKNIPVVEDGINGLLVPVKNSEALGKALIKLIDDPGLRKVMGQAGYEKARREFDEQNVCRIVLDTYKQLLDKKYDNN